MCNEEFIAQMCSIPLFTLIIFHTNQKPPQASLIFFCELKDFFFSEIWRYWDWDRF